MDKYGIINLFIQFRGWNNFPGDVLFYNIRMLKYLLQYTDGLFVRK